MILATTPLAAMGLAKRTAGALRLAGYTTFGEVAALTVDQLRAIPHFTAACLEDLAEVAFRRATGRPIGFLTDADRRRRLERNVAFYAAECERIGDAWAEAHNLMADALNELAELAGGEARSDPPGAA